MIPVYASHLRVRDTDGEPSTVCLLVRDHERAVLQTPLRGPAPDKSGTSEGQSTDPFEVFIGSPAPDDLDGLLQRTVERARDMLDGDSAFLLLAPTTRRNWRSAPPPACPRPASASPASPSRRAPAATAPPACRPSTRISPPSPAPSPSSTAPVCARSSPSR
ncbi:hypothetical protein GCM10023238_13180 [Streptomyces heliomycini]